jgi:hypothetical protein
LLLIKWRWWYFTIVFYEFWILIFEFIKLNFYQYADGWPLMDHIKLKFKWKHNWKDRKKIHVRFVEITCTKKMRGCGELISRFSTFHPSGRKGRKVARLLLIVMHCELWRLISTLVFFVKFIRQYFLFLCPSNVWQLMKFMIIFVLDK